MPRVDYTKNSSAFPNALNMRSARESCPGAARRHRGSFLTQLTARRQLGPARQCGGDSDSRSSSSLCCSDSLRPAPEITWPTSHYCGPLVGGCGSPQLPATGSPQLPSSIITLVTGRPVCAGLDSTAAGLPEQSGAGARHCPAPRYRRLLLRRTTPASLIRHRRAPHSFFHNHAPI